MIASSAIDGNQYAQDCRQHRPLSILICANMRRVQPQSLATAAPVCPPLLQGPLDQDVADQLAKALKTIADPARLRLLSLIQAQPDGEACVCHLTEPLGLSQPTVSHHLKVLRLAGLVERERRGSWAYYRVVPEALGTLRDILG
jgi:ArsR family transcriptional regulator